MIEPELAFADLPMLADLSEDYLKYLVADILENCQEDLQFFNQFIEKRLLDRLAHVKDSPFVRMTYSEAIKILESSGRSFEYPVKWALTFNQNTSATLRKSTAKHQ